MGKYLKAAFFVRLPVPGLGHVPVNVLAVIGLGALGVLNPGFWLLGAALEAGLVVSLAVNPRFQHLVDGRYLARADDAAERKRLALLSALPAVSRERMRELSGKCAQVVSLYDAAQADAFVIGSNRQTLRSLEWIYLKLLVAESNLRSQSADDGGTLTDRIARLEAELRDQPATDSLRQSKGSTLDILKRRLALWRRREQSLAEIASDLTRVEAQVDLLVENARLEGRPETLNTEIELATDLVGGVDFGDAEAAVHDVDLAYDRRAAVRAQASPTTRS
jgi:hypothetical protein